MTKKYSSYVFFLAVVEAEDLRVGAIWHGNAPDGTMVLLYQPFVFHDGTRKDKCCAVQDLPYRTLLTLPEIGLGDQFIPALQIAAHGLQIFDGVGGKLTGEALGCLLPGGTYAVVGYAGGREASVNLTDIIWKAAKVRGFTFRAFAPETLAAAQKTLIGYLSEGAIRPTIAKVFPLSDAADAVRHLIEDRPFGRVLMRVGD